MPPNGDRTQGWPAIGRLGGLGHRLGRHAVGQDAGDQVGVAVLFVSGDLAVPEVDHEGIVVVVSLAVASEISARGLHDDDVAAVDQTAGYGGALDEDAVQGRKISSMMVCLPTNSPLHEPSPIVRQTTSSWQASQKGAPLPLATSSKMAETSWALGESVRHGVLPDTSVLRRNRERIAKAYPTKAAPIGGLERMIQDRLDRLDEADRVEATRMEIESNMARCTSPRFPGRA